MDPHPDRPEPGDPAVTGSPPVTDEGPDVRDVPARGDVVPVDLRDYVSFSLDHATRVRALSTPGLALDQWCIEPQQSTGVLQYPDADVVHTVLGGRAWFVTEQGEIGLDPLGALLVPAGTVHGIDNRGTDPLIVATAMAPPDPLPVASPDDAERRAIRDDDQYGSLGRAFRATVDRIRGR